MRRRPGSLQSALAFIALAWLVAGAPGRADDDRRGTPSACARAVASDGASAAAARGAHPPHLAIVPAAGVAEARSAATPACVAPAAPSLHLAAPIEHVGPRGPPAAA